ncbi:FAD-dependent monooxygenase [Bacillus gobiensis]|uniref:FAD-dependent oxidoreductase n=1 Tax=Bacillus gobiensis TaxID=1441095 RepID=UPI003D1B390F
MLDRQFPLAEKNTERVIVIGGSIAGLLAARVLSGYYNEVLIIDRDDFPDKPENRSGTPQAFQPHRLTPRGILILGRFFPGYNEELLAHGAPSALNKLNHMINSYGSMVMANQENEATFSRALLEWVLRKRVQAIPNVRFLCKKEVIRLLSSTDRSTITGIQVQDRGTAERLQQTITANLVIDTSGRSSKVVRWLTELGYDVPKPEMLKVSLGYSTRHYRIPPHLAAKWNVIHLAGDPVKETNAGVFSIIENNRAEIVLWNIGGRYPSTNPEQYEREISQLASQLFAEVRQELEPIAAPRGYRLPELFRQRFEQMKRWPSGLLVMGDAFCNFDPIYGQGITVAAIEAEILEASLRDKHNNPEPDFELSVLKKMQDSIEPAWWLNCVSDLRWPGVEYVGSEPFKGLKFAQNYFEYILKSATEQSNYELYGLYWLVNSLFLHPRELFNPQMVTALFAESDSSDGNRLLDELTKGSDKPLEELLDQFIPSFERASFSSMKDLMQQSET